jgi:hypothetical protein
LEIAILKVCILTVIILTVVILTVVILTVVILTVIILTVVILTVVILTVGILMQLQIVLDRAFVSLTSNWHGCAVDFCQSNNGQRQTNIIQPC